MKRFHYSQLALFVSGLSLATLSVLPAMADYPACPQNQTAQELEKWRQGAIGTLGVRSGQPFYYNGGGMAGYGDSSGDPVAKLTTSIESCFPQKIPACLQRVHDFAEQQWVERLPPAPDTPEDQKRRLLPKEFWDEASVVNGEPTQFAFFKKNADGHGYKDIEEIAREKGWPMVRYKTRMSGGFDRTVSLLMIRVPGNKLTPPVNYDQYVNIPIPAEPNDAYGPLDQVKSVPEQKLPSPDDYNDPNKARSLPKIVTVVTVEKKQGDKPGRVYFTFYRNGGSSTFLHDRNPNPRAECYSCHPNGVRAISPYGFNVRDSELANGVMKPEAQWLATQEMNNSMNQNNGFSLVDWGKVVDPSGKQRPLLNPAGMGPVLGPIHPLNRKVITGEDGRPKTIYPTRTKEFIVGEDGQGGCARKFSPELGGWNGQQIKLTTGRGGPSQANLFKMTDGLPINWQKVRDQMNCASCHNNRIRGALNANISIEEIAFKILVDQSMPVGVHTTSRAGNGSVHDDLNANERIALVNCLNEEFKTEQTKVPEWLSQVSCSGDANANVASAINGMFPQPTVGSPHSVPRQGVTNRRAPVPRGHHSTASEAESTPSSDRAN